MGEVVSTNKVLAFSLTALAREFGPSRETLRKKMADAGVAPCGSGPNGYDLYRVRDVHEALSNRMSGEDFNPDELDAFARRAYYQSELEKLKLQTERGELLSRIEVERETARLFEIMGRFLDTLPDSLEREGGMAPRQVQRVEDLIDHLREELYKEIVDGADSAIDVASRG